MVGVGCDGVGGDADLSRDELIDEHKVSREREGAPHAHDLVERLFVEVIRWLLIVIERRVANLQGMGQGWCEWM